MSVQIPLRNRDGSVRAWTVVDDADADDLNQFRWSLGTPGYPRRGYREDGRHLEESMPRRLMGLKLGDPRQPDHIDRDKLNNQRSNLRIVAGRQNNQNVGGRQGSTSKYRGVRLHRGRRWMAFSSLNGEYQYLGVYDDEEEAARVAAEWRRDNMPYSIEALVKVRP